MYCINCTHDESSHYMVSTFVHPRTNDYIKCIECDCTITIKLTDKLSSEVVKNNFCDVLEHAYKCLHSKT
jgi:hypothetical protein